MTFKLLLTHLEATVAIRSSLGGLYDAEFKWSVCEDATVLGPDEQTCTNVGVEGVKPRHIYLIKMSGCAFIRSSPTVTA